MSLRLCPAFLFVYTLSIFLSYCQSGKYTLRTIGFYNVENLFDTIDDPETIDEAYTPSGKNHYSHGDYIWKIRNTASVISEIGSNRKNNGPDLIGLAEIENFKVLNDLIHTEELYRQQYQIIHHIWWCYANNAYDITLYPGLQ